MFFYFAMNEWTAQVKWQKMYEQEKARKVEELASIQQLQVKLAAQVVKSDQKTLMAQAELSKEKLARDQERDSNLKIQSQVTQLQNEVALSHATQEEVGREKDRLSAELNRARGVVLKIEQALNVERENATRYKNEKSEMEVSLNQLNAQYSSAQRDLKHVEQDLAVMNNKWQGLIRKGYMPGIGDDDEVSQPAVSGQTLAVRTDVGLVMLSVGTKNDVKPGMRFIISRGSDYIGKVQVETVYPDMCSAKIMPDFTNKNNLAFEIHDTAKTH